MILSSFLGNVQASGIAINIEDYMNPKKIREWNSDGSKRLKQIERFVNLFHYTLTPGDPGARKLPKNCESDPSFTNLRFWPSAKANCSDRQYTKLVEKLTQYDAQQVVNKDAEIASLRIAIQMLRDLNRRLKVEITDLEQFIEEDLGRIIRTYMQYVERTGHTFQTHDAHLQAHLTDLDRLKNLIQGAGQARGMLEEIENAQAEANRLLELAQNAGDQELAGLRQQVQDAQAIINATNNSLAALQQQIRIIYQTFNR